MRIEFHKAHWGMGHLPLEQAVEQIKEAGYDGMEVHIQGPPPAEAARLCREYRLKLLLQITGDDAETLTDYLHRAAEHGPELIVTHAGRDHFTLEEGCAFWEEVLKVQDSLGIPVAHETHRSRLLYSPWSTAKYLKQFPELRINADFSHWCCVSESLLQHLDGMVEAAIGRAIHIHGRVGYEEGPQVSDPRAPEFARHLEAHKKWWHRIRKAREADGTDVLRFVPEFGPPPYMPTLPHTRQPISDLWEVCLWIRDEMKKEFEI